VIRTFVAVGLPENNLKQIEEWIRRLRGLDIHARFPRIESIHLTLKFLGEIDEAKVTPISQALESAAEGIVEFDLSISGMGTFPSPKNPRVVWLGISESGILKKLQRSVDHHLAACGFTREKRPFRPHLTLARMKSKRNLESLQHFLESEGNTADAGNFTVDSYHLYQSILHPSGARYTRLFSHSLGGG
jgi:2'-5' RNA ligase